MSKNSIFQMRVDEEFIRQLDECRREDADLPSRAEMLRKLVAAAYEKIEARRAKRANR